MGYAMAVKQVIHLNTQFFYSLSLQPPTSIDELFKRGKQYTMLEEDVVATTKKMVASTFDSRGGSEGKGKSKRIRRNRDAEVGAERWCLGSCFRASEGGGGGGGGGCSEFRHRRRASKIHNFACMSSSYHPITFRF